jgi:hypothetical protein
MLVRSRPELFGEAGDSGAKRERALCSECGSLFYGADVGDGAETLSSRVGTLGERREPPSRRQT